MSEPQVVDLVKIQQEVGEWSVYNFPTSPGYHSLMGMQEEIGELTEAHLREDTLIDAGRIPGAMYWLLRAIMHLGRMTHAVLKAEQGIRGDRFKLMQDAYQEGVWAVRSLSKFLFMYLGTATAKNLFRDGERDYYAPTVDLTATGEEPIQEQKTDALADCLIYAMDYAHRAEINLGEGVAATWTKVRERDWQKYPQTGRPPVEKAVSDAQSG